MNKDIVKAVQVLLQKIEPRLIIDGRLGTFTRAAYNRAPMDTQLLIGSYLKASADTNWEKLTMQPIAPKVVGVVPKDVNDAITAAADEFGIPATLLFTFARIESNFNPSAKNGSSRGLFQMQPKAWIDASTVTKLKPYMTSWSDPIENARAAAAYRVVLQRQLRKWGFNEAFTPEVSYMAHQQGAQGFTELWRAATGKPQLWKPAVSTESMLRNPPQDRQGPTTDKAEFFNRWMEVVRRKYA